MHIFDDPMVMRQVIMDHYQHPRNRRIIDNPQAKNRHMHTAGCVDDIHIYMLIEDHKVKDVSFEGVACTISTSSTSMMTELLHGKTIEEAKYIIAQYQAMIQNETYDGSVLNDAVVLKNTHKQASRINCALIGWKAAIDILKEE
jgi:nitrogen fixation protein NifU and related proteins